MENCVSVYPSTFFKQRERLRKIIAKVERLEKEIDNQNIKELLDTARVDLSNALNIANAIRKKKVHHITKQRVLKLIIGGVTIKKIALQCDVSENYITKLMRANNINRYNPRKILK